ncbi:orotidine-5'-phosphate decarboxylase [Persephonella atlantica]|uniref:Orotidine 5'-phosphate decarboxylase n=1 Tax=Persephonella atlantica TaxID=2699429 RepID=A0ABS1GGM5_9AQUI|nr:orotidine-5'-phosphate decarboxylase [Persephonella atlantica]MBK3332071.1 orotidine-5'-phosphate decarboxylase [Persephonella atlantica]
MEKKLAIALDVPEKNAALEILDELEGMDLIIKVGYSLFLREGFDLLSDIKRRGFDIFLDLKLHDIPNTVYNAIASAVDMDINYLTLHALGGKDMLSKAVEAKGSSGIKLLAVTVLTSHGEDYLEFLGSRYSIQQLALKLAQTAIEAGIDGIVSSPFEVKELKEHIGKDFISVTPGIRFEKEEREDQKRSATPEFAIREGADILVIGRPVLRSKNRRKLVKEILQKLKNA